MSSVAALPAVGIRDRFGDWPPRGIPLCPLCCPAPPLLLPELAALGVLVESTEFDFGFRTAALATPGLAVGVEAADRATIGRTLAGADLGTLDLAGTADRGVDRADLGALP